AFAERAGRKLRFNGTKRIVERIHEDSTHGIDDEDALAATRFEEPRALSRRARRVVDRPEDTVFVVDEPEDLLLVGPMIARRQNVDSGREQFVRDRARQAKAAGRVLAIGDDKIEAKLFLDPGQLRRHDVATRTADDVSDEEQAHWITQTF